MSNYSPFSLAPASLTDLSQLRTIEKTCFPLDAWPLLELLGVLILPNLVKIKAVADEKMVGFVGGDAKRDENIGWITTIGVLPEYQRKGIATALLEECEKQMGLPYIRLTVRKSNFAALQLYRHLGYRQIDVWDRYYEGGEDGLVLEKKRF